MINRITQSNSFNKAYNQKIMYQININAFHEISLIYKLNKAK